MIDLCNLWNDNLNVHSIPILVYGITFDSSNVLVRDVVVYILF
jgi:hypothetical protein